jgi:glycosyltransferase involved in cell wall biosynthesis
MEKKNILYICPSSGLGGAETFLKTTFLSYDSARFNTIYLLFQKGPLYDWLINKKAIVEVLPQRPRLSRPLSIYKTHIYIRDVIRKNKIDLVHSTMAYGALFAAKAAQAEGCRHIWFQHGPASGWMDQCAAILPHQAVLVNSHYTLKTQQSLEKNISWLLPKERYFKKINLGTPSPSFSIKELEEFKKNLLLKHQLSQDTMLFAMACRLQKWKGVDLLVDAVHKLSVPQRSFFVLVWGDTFDSENYVDQLKQNTKNLPISLEGPTSNVPLAFAACDVIINASLRPEPFGLSLIEALSVGNALLGPDNGGPAEIIKPEHTGLCFSTGSATSLAEQISRMINDRPLVEKMKKNARSSYETMYTSELMMKSLESLYEKIISSTH